jgi:hypothetical protein
MNTLFKVAWGGAGASNTITRPIVDAQGAILDVSNLSYTERCFLQLTRKFLAFDILSIIGGYFVVSQRTQRLLAEHRVASDVAVRPVEISINGVKWPDPYYWLSSVTCHNIVDRGRSKCSNLSETDMLLRIHQWVIDPGLVPNFDLFRADAYVWVATNTLKHNLETHGFTNFDFTELRVG